MKYIPFLSLISLFFSVQPAAAGIDILSSDSLHTGYTENNDYREPAFPMAVRSVDFSIPSDGRQLLVVYPREAENRVPRWQESLEKTFGTNLSFAYADTVSEHQLASRHLILLGNISNNRRLLELYQIRAAYADANFPGKGGYIIHPATSVWNRDRNILVIGASDMGDLDKAFRVFTTMLPAGGTIGPLRALSSDLSLPKAPADIEAILRNGLKPPYASMPPYGTIADWGFYYHLTGDTTWATHFKAAFHMLYNRARATGKWIPEPWTNVYFNLWKLMLVWDRIDDDVFFTKEDRAVIEEVLWGYTTFIRWLPNLNADQAPKGEMRQNHTTFLALSLYFSYRYYTEKYNLDGLEPMMEKVYRAFEDGQMASFIPNDDAGGYLKYVPQHTLTYLLAEGNLDYIRDSSLAHVTDLVGVTFDNFGNQVSFGDVGGYSHRPRHTADLNFFTMAANYYQEPEYQWMYSWLNKNPSFSLEALYTGEYAVPMASAEATRFLGVRPIYLDGPTLSWFGRRAENNHGLPRRGDTYFHKISFRGGFNPDNEYLLLDGISALSHGHHDGNSILRLTWKERIWLFDLDYIKLNTRFHNGVTVVRDGQQYDPPAVTLLDLLADGPNSAVTQSTAQHYNGADWQRSIIWSKNRWFLVLDRIKAVEPGNYRMTGRWRTRGDVALKGNVLQVDQGDKSFFIKSADEAVRNLDFEPDRYRSSWGDYPYGDGLEVLAADREAFLPAGEDFIFANLLAASDDNSDPGYTLLRVEKGLYQVTGPEGPTLIGLNNAHLKDVAIFTDAAMFRLDSETLEVFGYSVFRFHDIAVATDSGTGHLVIDLQKGEIRNMSDLTRSHMSETALRNLNTNLAALTGVHRPAMKVLPEASPKPFRDFAIHRLAQQETGQVSAHSRPQDGYYALGHTTGEVSVFEGETLIRNIQTPHRAEITAIALTATSVGEPLGVVAGDILGNLYGYSEDGTLEWTHGLTAYSGPDSHARDILIDRRHANGHSTILVGTAGWKVYAFDPDGSKRWESFIFYHSLTKLGIMDDGPQRYLVAGTEYQTPFNMIDPETGSVMYFAWEEMGSEFISSTDYLGYHLTDMAFFDANGNGTKDLVFGTYSNTVYAVEAADGEKIWEVNVGGGVTRVVVFDDPATGGTRLLVGNDLGGLILIDGKGKRVAQTALGHRITDLLVLPKNGEGVNIAVVTDGGELAVVDHSLKIRGFYEGENAYRKVCHTEGTGNAHRLLAIGEYTIETFEYEPLYLWESRQY